MLAGFGSQRRGTTHKQFGSNPVEEFLRRFLLHVLPRGFVRIRHFGLFAHRRRAALLPLCFQLLASPGETKSISPPRDTGRTIDSKWATQNRQGRAEPVVLLRGCDRLSGRLQAAGDCIYSDQQRR